MRRNLWLIPALLAVLSFPLSAFCSASRVPNGSFLRYSASSPYELSSAVRNDRVVASRYERHYHMSAKKIAEYFKSNLVAGTLKHDGTYCMYFMDGNKIVTHRVHLKVGERVFFAQNGAPVIDVRCGNPISNVLPGCPATSSPVSGAKAEREESIIPVTQEPAFTEVAEVFAPQYEKIEVAGIQQVSDLTAVPATAVENLSSSSFNLVGVASGLASLGALSIVTSKHSSPPVPEPSSLLLLAGGFGTAASAVLGRRLRRKL